MASTLRARRAIAAAFVAAIVLAGQANAADCDGNGVEDAIDVQPSGPGYRLMRKMELPSALAGVALADMNGDGLVDVTALSHESGEVFVALGEGAWSWAEPSRTPTRLDHDIMVVEDLDSDGISMSSPPVRNAYRSSSTPERGHSSVLPAWTW